jgi:hypothetical protein
MFNVHESQGGGGGANTGAPGGSGALLVLFALRAIGRKWR